MVSGRVNQLLFPRELPEYLAAIMGPERALMQHMASKCLLIISNYEVNNPVTPKIIISCVRINKWNFVAALIIQIVKLTVTMLSPLKMLVYHHHERHVKSHRYMCSA